MRCKHCGLEIYLEGGRWSHLDSPYYYSCRMQVVSNEMGINIPGELTDNERGDYRAEPYSIEERIKKIICAVDTATD